MRQDMSWEAGQKMNIEDDKSKAGQELIVSLIQSWDLTDENGKNLPITLENLSKLPVKDVAQVMEYSTNLVKQKDSSTLQTSEPVMPDPSKANEAPEVDLSNPVTKGGDIS
jgi:hypothetical protein